MKIKTFNFPTFKEWEENSYDRFETKLGDYRVEVGAVCWTSGEYEITYGFAVSLANVNSLNFYTKKIFYRYFKFTGDTKALKNWYESIIREFNDFWENYIAETYIEKTK